MTIDPVKLNSTNVAAEATAFVDRYSSGKIEEAIARFAELMGTDSKSLPPIDVHDASSLPAEFMNQVFMQMRMRDFVTQEYPRMMKNVKFD